LVAAVGSWAAAHPLPTWPQTLPLDFHVPPMLGAAATWHLEQVASGTATLDPRWAALRLAPLVGSAALWAVASSVMRLPRRERPKTAQNREATFLVQEPVKRPIRKPDVHAPS
jgi:hypothetical protein